ncbi:MAG: hypothetical protein MUF75_11395 [Bacteroidia bacterium]|jgi:hypothetical protein|nr:hypothetical protein [Bacteroidia bacterium]
MRKKGNIIFVGMFLLSSVFTIFNYLPLLEEENSAQKLELYEKNGQNNACEDENTENTTFGSDECLITNSPFIKTSRDQTHWFTRHDLPCFAYYHSSINPPPEA